jgi:hypothetical protein
MVTTKGDNMSNQIVKIIEESNVEKATAQTLLDSFLPFFTKAQEWSEKAKALVVTDATQITEMKQAREARLIMRQIRIDADKTRKELKEDSLRYGKAVQGVYNVIEFLIAPIEQHLQDQEDFAKIAEKKRQDELRIARTAEIEAFQSFMPPLGDLGTCKQEEFERWCKIAKDQKESQEAQARKEAQESLERAEAEAKERERIAKENEELRKQAQQAEAERKEAERMAMEERAKAQKVLDEERAERAKIEAEIKAKAEAERKEAERMAMEEKKAKSAPDKVKLLALASSVNSLELPTVSSQEAEEILLNVRGLLLKVSAYIVSKSESI